MGSTHPLRTYRNEHALSRAALAALLEVSIPTVWRWEEGKRRVDDELLSVVSQKTGIPKAKLRPDLADLLQEAAE